jgi:hypothetical protein
MPKRTVAILTTVVFGLFSTSCMTWRMKEIRTGDDPPRQGKRVLRVVKRSGEVVDFSRTAPARIIGDQVVGTPAVLGERDVEIEGPFPLIKKLADGSVSEITDAKGRIWSVREVLKEGPDRMTVRISETRACTVAIPFSDIQRVKIMRTSRPLTFLAALTGTAAGLFGAWMIMWKIGESKH